MAHSIGLAHQIGTLCGSPRMDAAPSSGTSDRPNTPPRASVSALWQPAPDLRCVRTHRKALSADLDLGVLTPPTAVAPLTASRSGATSPLPPLYGAASASVRPDIAMACRALADSQEAVAVDAAANAAAPRDHAPAPSRAMPPKPVRKPNGSVPVYVMLPLDTVKPHGGGLNRKKAMNASLMALRSAGVEGIMVDVWWGVVEREGPGRYDWSGYAELFEMARKLGLKVQAVMSFHQCGGNVGDSCTIPLPRWVTEEIDRDQDLAYTDQWGRRNYECVSLACDTLPVLKGRTPVQCYADYMRAFRDRFCDLLGSTIVEIQVGMGPAGELRYPSYPEQHGTWRFPGIGAFQCYGRYMLGHLKAAADAAGKPEWGHTGPTDAGGYNSWPEDTPFFRRDGGWNSEYGEFFLSWYSGMLLDHGDRILSAANAVFLGGEGEVAMPVKISVKVAGIHWHYGTRSHAAELTAGYYNTRGRDGYLPIARLLARHGAVLNFTCIEMRDHEQPQDAQCRPQALVRQVAMAAREAGVELAGENALPRYDEAAHDQIVRSAVFGTADDGKQLEPMCAFTYLRMFPDLFHPHNWRKFVAFVKKMAAGRGGDAGKCLEQVERESAPLISEAAAAMASG